MSKELDEFYKKYSARIIEMDDTPLVKVMDGGKFKLLSIEEYEQMITKISDLEAKLAEYNEYFKCFSCKDFNEFKDFISTFMLTPHEEQTLIRELKQQLAEKEEEIKQLNNRILLSQLQAPKEQILNILCSQCIQYNPDQDKISFAVEQILDIKEEVFGTREMGIIFDIPPVQDAFNAIENKIKQLKEGK